MWGLEGRGTLKQTFHHGQGKGWGKWGLETHMKLSPEQKQAVPQEMGEWVRRFQGPSGAGGVGGGVPALPFPWS